MLYSGCQSKSKEISITEKICPQCGNPVELFSTDTEVNKGIPGRQTLPGTALLVRLALREHVLQENAVALLGAVDKDVCDGSDEPAVL